MRVVALLSGGKDSVAAVHVARNWGWDVVGACILQVAGEDSHMFHRPNARWAPLVAEALDLPVFVGETDGRDEEEVGDLQALLEVAQAETGADGVVSGALASEYQRVRIERVGHALGLRTFTPLWHKPPRLYMAWLVAARFHVRVVHVAAEGLGRGWLGRLLTPRALVALERQAQRFGFHLAGEGGEYETLVTDGPGFRRPLVVDAAATEWHRDAGTWSISGAHLGAERDDSAPSPLPEE